MSVKKRKNRQSIRESFRFSGDRFGFLGTGFGKLNTYNPYESIKEEEEKQEVLDDVWSGGENLVEPKEYVKIYHGLEAVKAPETHEIVTTESRLRMLIRTVLKESLT